MKSLSLSGLSGLTRLGLRSFSSGVEWWYLQNLKRIETLKEEQRRLQEMRKLQAEAIEHAKRAKTRVGEPDEAQTDQMDADKFNMMHANQYNKIDSKDR